VTTIIIKLDL
jgi:predicted DsbA family dithiol-disulfide isomerase